MPAHVIISYDGTDNDHDALVLGRLLGAVAGRVGIAYVRHTHEDEPAREQTAQGEAENLLAVGAHRLDLPQVETHVVVSASTSRGLSQLADSVGADLIVFGSDYRTPPGRLRAGASAQRLLDGGPTAIALALAGMHFSGEAPIGTISLIGEDPAARTSAEQLAGALGATLVEDSEPSDLIVFASRDDAAPGRVTLSAASSKRLEETSVPVLVIPHGVALEFAARTAVSA